jgi:predicted CXXCH cytochrome family protein
LNRHLKKINWGETGEKQDKHGGLIRDGSSQFREPYLTAAVTKNDFVLSCLDCHEPHGSENIMLLRRRVNGENLEGTILSTEAMSFACKRCHMDDATAGAGTSEADRWEFVHHKSPAAPFGQVNCVNCHATGETGGPGGNASPIPCGNCHGHGMNDGWAGVNATGRITF